MPPLPLALPEDRYDEAEDLRAACAAAADAAATRAGDHEAVQAALDALHARLPGAFVSAFVFEHDRLWRLGSCGYTTIPHGMSCEDGVMGRAVRTGEAQFVEDPASDPDRIETVSGIASEVAVPLHAAGRIVGVLGLESTIPLPPEAAGLVAGVGEALAPRVAAVLDQPLLDLAALARLFVHVSSLRHPRAIAGAVTGALLRVLPLETASLHLRAGRGTLDRVAAVSVPGGPEPLEDAAVTAFLQHLDARAIVELFETAGMRLPQLAGSGLRTVVLLPLRANGEDIGVLAGATRRRERLDPGRGELAALLCAHTATSLDAALALGREREVALTDQLTGLLNRRGIEEGLQHELERAAGGRRVVSLLLLDCDDFKRLNDRAGHELGDVFLGRLGEALSSLAPAGGLAGRLGGDEFVVTLPGAAAEAAEEAAAALRLGVQARLSEEGYPVQTSVGVATFPFDGGTAAQLLRAADQAMYHAKATGKDRVVGYRALGERRQAPAPSPADAAGAGLVASVARAASALWEHDTVEGLLSSLCRALAFATGATGASASRLERNQLLDVSSHALHDADLGEDAVYVLDDFPLTRRVLEAGRPEAISFLDDDVDPAEALVLRELGMSACLLLPLVVSGAPWGLVEVYDRRLRRFSDADVEIAAFLAGQGARRLAALAHAAPPRRPLPVFRMPAGGLEVRAAPRVPRER